MNGIDVFFIALISLSAVYGLFRGFVKEALSLLAWLLAGLVAKYFTEDLLALSSPLKTFLADNIKSENGQYALAFALLFFATLLLLSVFNVLLTSAINRMGVAWLNRFLGFSFGVLRGAVIVVVLALLINVSPWQQSLTWQASLLAQPVVQAGQQLWLKTQALF